jgi:hypothetical protein
MPRTRPAGRVQTDSRATGASTPPAPVQTDSRATGASTPPAPVQTDSRATGASRTFQRRVWERTRADKLRDQGLCPKCGKRPPPEGRTYCVVCRTREREVYAQRKAQGLCPVCGKRPPYGWYSRCIPCITRQKPAKRRYQSRQKEARRQGLRT